MPIVEDKRTDLWNVCGVCGNRRGGDIHKSQAPPPPNYQQADHRFIAAAPRPKR